MGKNIKIDKLDGIENIQQKCLFSFVNIKLPDCLQS